MSVLCRSRNGIVPKQTEKPFCLRSIPEHQIGYFCLRGSHCGSCSRNPCQWWPFLEEFVLLKVLGVLNCWEKDACCKLWLFWSLMKPTGIFFVSEIALTPFTSEWLQWQPCCQPDLILIALLKNCAGTAFSRSASVLAPFSVLILGVCVCNHLQFWFNFQVKSKEWFSP